MALGIRAKLTITMLLATMIPLSGFWVLNYNTSKNQIESNFKADLTELSAKSVQKLDDWLDTNRRALESLSMAPNLAKLDEREQKQALRATSTAYPWLQAAYITDTKGQQLLRSDSEKLQNIKERAYFKAAMEGKFGQTVAVSLSTKKPSLLIGLPVMESPGSKSIVATVVSISHLEEISRQVTGTPVGKTGYRFIMAPDGKLLAHFDPKETAKKGEGNAMASYEQHPLWAARDDKGIAFKRFAYDGQEWIGSVERSKLGWYVATVQTTEEAEVLLRKASNQALLVLALASVLVFLIALAMGTAVAIPLNQLSEITNKIAEDRGNSDDDALEHGQFKDEIRELAAAIRRLSASVRGQRDASANRQR